MSSLDTAESEAQGGTERAPEEAMLLFPFLSDVQLQDTDFNHRTFSQAQRIRTASERSTLEQRRATPHPADAVYLVSGDLSGHHERRKPAPRDARWGAMSGTRATMRAQGQGDTPNQETPPAHGAGPSSQALSGAPGEAHEAADRGIFRGQGQRASEAARVPFARPNLDRGPAATPAVHEDARVQDDVNAELLAARLERSLVDASLQRSTRRGPGLGGQELGDEGFAPQGTARGAKATPLLPGPGRAGVLDTSDARYLHWFTNQRARVQERLVFPEARALAKDQGVSVFRVHIRRGGQLLGEPVLLRSSGYRDFDQAALLAIQQAAPLEPLPDALAPEQTQLSLVIPVQFENPMVQ